jgi:hypothetical protein
MFMKKIFILFFMILSNAGFAQVMRIDVNANCINILNDISSLQFRKATTGIYQELKSNPTNVFPVVLANYIDFFELFFNENAAQYKERKQNEGKRIDAIDLTSEQSPYFLHSKACIYLQWSLVKLKFKDYISATRDARKAYFLFQENKEKFPNFDGGDTYMGCLQAVIGSVPSQYQWMAGILGMKGNLKKGTDLIQNALISPTNVFKTDAFFANIYLMQYLQNNPAGAWAALKKRRKECANNRLLTFLTANIATNQNKAEEAIAVITENQKQEDALAMPILDFELGCAYFYKIDKNAFVYLQKYLTNFKGKFYRKDAYYKMAMLAYLNGDAAKANAYADAINEQPSSEADADKTADVFGENKNWPNKELLKVRCLYDGGYFKQALQAARQIKILPSIELEYHYRIARIFDETKELDSASQHYLQTIALGAKETSYFAAKASLQLAMIYEEQNKKNLAIQYYKLSMKLKNKEFKNSIDMIAKAGLQRVGG